jgi:hypothetical protein
MLLQHLYDNKFDKCTEMLLLHLRSEPQNLSPPTPPPFPDQNHSLYEIDLHALVQPGTEVLLAVSTNVKFSFNPSQKWECCTIGKGQSLSGQVGTCHHATPPTRIRACYILEEKEDWCCRSSVSPNLWLVGLSLGLCNGNKFVL